MTKIDVVIDIVIKHCISLWFDTYL